jgi:lysophospholipase L1-like esterase
MKFIKLLLKLILALFILAICCLILEKFAATKMTSQMETAREILLADSQQQLTRVLNTMAQPYLLYVCAPNYVSPENGPQHNRDGYRGDLIPMERTPGTLRILCMGGSTTYGATVAKPEQSYPAQLEEIIRENLPEGYTDVEVINGGLPWGTSAEILTHYHFKYHYYKPDLVIINEGGNDAEGATQRYYHPDNSNWRQPMQKIRPLPENVRFLAESRFLSYLMLNIFYRDQMTGGLFYINGGAEPPAPWFRPGGELVTTPREIPRDQLDFAHNMETLIREVQHDGAKVVLVPFRAAPGTYEANGKDFELSQILRNEEIFKDYSEEYNTGFAPFPASTISEGNWTDHCHLNAAGSHQKAEHIASYVLKSLANDQKKADGCPEIRHDKG